jgi:hypothetical protein
LSSGSAYTQRGDGAGVLTSTISDYYGKWNPNSSENDAATNGGSNGSNAREAGGYSSSHIRATLIGENEKTDVTYAGDVNLTASTCLYSCVDSELRSVITPKKIKYVTGSSTSSYNLNEDIADSIWLFSEREIYSSASYSGGTTEGIGETGVGYSKFGNASSKYKISSYSNGRTTNRQVYTEGGSTTNWWLRSLNLQNAYRTQYAVYNGSVDFGNAHEDRNIAFGFCID